MALLSGSTRRPTVAIGPPSAGIHAHVVSATKAPRQTASAAANASSIAPIDTSAAGEPARRSGATTASRTKATKGIPRTNSGSQTGESIALTPEQGEAGRPDPPPDPEDPDDDRQPDGHHRHPDGDWEERENQPPQVALETPERDENDVNRR